MGKTGNEEIDAFCVRLCTAARLHFPKRSAADTFLSAGIVTVISCYFSSY